MIRAVLRWLLAAFYGVAGWFHLTAPGPFLAIVPSWLPLPELVVFCTGIAELAGALVLAQPFSPPLRKAGAIGLALYALAVWPANFNHLALDLAREDGGWGLGYHVPRLLAQPLLIWLPLWAGEVIDWPLRPRRA